MAEYSTTHIPASAKPLIGAALEACNGSVKTLMARSGLSFATLYELRFGKRKLTDYTRRALARVIEDAS